jgi:DNA-binding response OmpR family regulator
MAQFASPTALIGQTVLLAEDEALISFDVEQTLRRSGADVVVAAPLSESLLAAERPDLTCAVLDMKLGQQTIEPVCLRLNARGVPFLFTSGFQSPSGETWKHIPVLSKPVDAATLVNALVIILAENAARRIVYPKAGDRLCPRR